MVEVPARSRPYLRRAYSVADSDPVTGNVELLIKTIGAGTGALEELPESAGVRLLGPLGNAFDVSGFEKGERAAIVAGGIGAAPFPALLKALRQAGVPTDFYLGGRNERELSIRRRFEGLVRGDMYFAMSSRQLPSPLSWPAALPSPPFAEHVPDTGGLSVLDSPGRPLMSLSALLS